MKSIIKTLTAGLFLLLPLFIFSSCETGPNGGNGEDSSGSNIIVQENTVIDGSKLDSNAWAFITYSLNKYNQKKVKISFSAEMKVTNNGSKDENLMWQVNASGYPVIASYSFPKGESDFVKVTGTTGEALSLDSNNSLYLTTYGTEYQKLKIELKNVQYTITVIEEKETEAVSWISDSVPSIYETYKDQFDYFGLVCGYEYGLKNDYVQKGLKRHANSYTPENEFKIGFMMGEINSSTAKTKFTASNGLTIDVPAKLSGFARMDDILTICKNNGLQIRGHVLLWHAGTTENFFAENYSATISGELISNIVDKDTMTARQEWYIKTMLEHVTDWENKNNGGKHVVWAWDIVNEAMADDADHTNYLRGSTSKTKNKSPENNGSRWYQIYESDEFIINAFRFATAYAPEDVKLCYNDYNEYMNYWGDSDNGWKTDAICTTIDRIQNAAAATVNGKSVKPRIDALGMQSHVTVSWPGPEGYETAVKRFLEKGIDIHVTELDFPAATQSESSTCYGDYFKMLQKYGNKSGRTNKITCVTIWGINNKDSWIYKGNTKYPVLFDNYNVTDSYWAVIKAHE